MTRTENYYQVLNVGPDASQEDIKKAYKRLARVYHPDLNPTRPRSAENQFKRLQAAYSVLSDPIARQKYDLSTKSYSSRGARSTVSVPPAETIRPRHDLRNFWESPLLRNLSTRRKVALCLWFICLIGSFLPASSLVFSWNEVYEIPFGARLLWITIPLVMIWCGSAMSDTSDYDVSPGSVIKEGFGRVLEFAAWVYFARLIGMTVIGPLLLLIS